MKYIDLDFNTSLKFRLPETFSWYQPRYQSSLTSYWPVLKITLEPVRPAEDAAGTAKTFAVSEISK